MLALPRADDALLIAGLRRLWTQRASRPRASLFLTALIVDRAALLWRLFTGAAARARDLAANGARPLRGGARSELRVEGRARAARRRGHRDAARDDVAALADGAGSRAAALDALAHRRPAGDGEERHRAALHQRRQQRPAAAGPAAGLAGRRGARHRHRDRRAAAGAEPAGRLQGRSGAQAAHRRTTSSPTPGTSSCAPATRSGRRACR